MPIDGQRKLMGFVPDMQIAEVFHGATNGWISTGPCWTTWTRVLGQSSHAKTVPLFICDSSLSAHSRYRPHLWRSGAQAPAGEVVVRARQIRSRASRPARLLQRPRPPGGITSYLALALARHTALTDQTTEVKMMLTGLHQELTADR